MFPTEAIPEVLGTGCSHRVPPTHRVTVKSVVYLQFLSVLELERVSLFLDLYFLLQDSLSQLQ